MIKKKAPPALPRQDREAGELQSALSELVRVYQFRDRKRVCYYDLSVTQCYTLEAIIRLESPRVDDVASELYLEKSTASRVVDALAKKGYVIRRPDPRDGRAVQIRATQKGRRLHQRIEEDLLAQTQDILNSFDSKTRQATTRLLNELARSARERFCANLDQSDQPKQPKQPKQPEQPEQKTLS